MVIMEISMLVACNLKLSDFPQNRKLVLGQFFLNNPLSHLIKDINRIKRLLLGTCFWIHIRIKRPSLRIHYQSGITVIEESLDWTFFSHLKDRLFGQIIK